MCTHPTLIHIYATPLHTSRCAVYTMRGPWPVCTVVARVRRRPWRGSLIVRGLSGFSQSIGWACPGGEVYHQEGFQGKSFTSHSTPCMHAEALLCFL